MKVCTYCNTTNDDSAKACTSCGGNSFKSKCGNCGTVFDSGLYCPKCGVKAGSIAKKCSNCGTEYFSNACPNCGYINGTKQDAVNTTVVYANVTAQPAKKRKTWLWVLGWIFIFPVPLTILMLRNQKLNKRLRIGIIVAAWLVYLLIGFSGRNSADNNSNLDEPAPSIESSNVQTSDNSGQTDENDEAATKELSIETFVENYNTSASVKLVFVEDFTVPDKESGHYRTEFRLNAYQDAIGKSYRAGELTVDIISRETMFGETDIRIYADGASLEQCSEIIRIASPLLDASLDESVLEDTISYVNENKEANGYYYGELGLLLLGNENDGYNLIIKTD